ncbi:MAG: bifunctional oligoribonuclease/PAP phosphatase NrnA [Clostridiales bacterium]|nr:bifunctional oligoribonuclease/PAP phosphatase NrnA [Clostridiales bacterium]
MINTVLSQIFEAIEKSPSVMLFRHRRIDGDCVGATKGLKGIIHATWPEKKVYIIDNEKSEYLSFMGADDEAVSDEVYKNALGIVIDVANADRISNQKYSLCSPIIKIDHHIDREAFGDINWVEEDRSSACEMIAHFYSVFQNKLKINTEAATYIYTGMLTDSGRFQYEGVTGDTLRLAGLMLDQKIDIETLNAHLYMRDFDQLKFKAFIYENMCQTPGGVAYIHVTKEIQAHFHLNFESASNAISSLSDIKGILCWLAFIDAEGGEIRVRLRSRFAHINTIAEKYHGGGHACASGATVYSLDEMKQLIDDADKHISEYKKTHTGWL